MTVDLDAVRARHGHDDDPCRDCRQSLPCDAIQLADEIERLTSLVALSHRKFYALDEKNDRLREALEFYADEDRYDEGMGGSVARAALEQSDK